MLKQELQQQVLTLTLNRPEVRNAFNAELIAQLTDAFQKAHESTDVRVVILRGEGENFSAGADLNWMLDMKARPMEENVADTQALATMLLSIHSCRKPVVAVVQGAVMGGGVGLTACADIALATDDAFFALSETRLGLTPATISPFVVNAIGTRQASRYMLTGERMSARQALNLGLVHDVVAADEIELTLNNILRALVAGGPSSHRRIKKLIRDVSQRPLNEELMENLAWRIANQRVSEEGQEGISAFLNKRKPNWIPEQD